MIAATNETFILVKNASVTETPMRVSPWTSTRRSGAARTAKICSETGKQPKKAMPTAVQDLIRRERSSSRWEVKGIWTSAGCPLRWLVLTYALLAVVDSVGDWFERAFAEVCSLGACLPAPSLFCL